MLPCLYTSFIIYDRIWRRHLTDTFNDWVGHLNTILAWGGQEFEQSNLQNFKCPGFAPGGGGGVRQVLKFWVDHHITTSDVTFLVIYHFALQQPDCNQYLTDGCIPHCLIARSMIYWQRSSWSSWWLLFCRFISFIRLSQTRDWYNYGMQES